MWYQNYVPAPNRASQFSVQSFTGGLNNASTVLGLNQATDIRNMEFRDETTMAKRFGTTLVDGVKTSKPITHLDAFKPYKEDEILVRGTQEELLIGDVPIPVSDHVDGLTHMGSYFFCYGDALYVYTQVPEANVYVEVTGTHQEGFHVFKVIPPTSNATVLGTEHVQGVRAFSFVTKTVYYAPCQLELEDVHKGPNVPPDRVKFLASHKNRLFVSGHEKDDDNVFITDALNPYYFPVTMPMQLPPNSDKVRGLKVYDDSVLVSREHDLYAITGDTNNPALGAEIMRLRRLNTHTGFLNHKVAHAVHNSLFYLGADHKVYALSSARQAEKTLVTTPVSEQLDFKKKPLELSDADVEQACAIYHDDMYYLSMGPLILAHSYPHRAWTVYDNLRVHSFAKRARGIIMGDLEGHVKKFDESTYMDKGLPFRAKWSSMWLDMNDSLSYKHFKEVFVLGTAYTDSNSTVKVSFEIDYSDVQHSYTVENNMSVWGVSAFGSRYVTRNINQSYPLHIGTRGRTLRFTLANGTCKEGEVEDMDALRSLTRMREGMLYYVKSRESWHLYENFEFREVTLEELNQPMHVLQVNGDYEFRTKR